MTKLADIIARHVRGEGPKPKKKLTPTFEREPETPINGSELEDEEKAQTIVTEEYETAFQLIEAGEPFVFITGKAGAGKSTFTELLKDRLNNYAVIAPTGVAALNVGGQTIHSFFKLRPGPINLEQIGKVRDKTAYRALKTLIIDEISMVRADLLDAIDKRLRENRPSYDVPFGGVQVIAIGDLFQLPPIVSTEEEQLFLSGDYATPFFFSAKALLSSSMRTVEFTKVFRQKEEAYIEILNSIRSGKKLNIALEKLEQRVRSVSASNTAAAVILTGTNAAASKINTARMAQIAHEPVTYLGEITGEFRVDKKKLPAEMELTLKSTAQVMFVKNDGAKRWVNGTLGVVTSLEEDAVCVEIDTVGGKREHRVEAERWKNYKYEYDPDKNAVRAKEVGVYTQIPLAPAWAVTIHKSQGKTFDQVHIDLRGGAFAEGQVYVALSRCTTLQGLTLERPLRKEDVILNYDVIQFCEKLRQQP